MATPAAGIARMGGTPSLDATGVGRAAEVLPALVRLPPAALAGGLAGLAALGPRAVLLVVAAAWIGVVQLMAVAALTLSAANGHAFQIGAPASDQRPPGPPEIEDEAEKKSQRKKTKTEEDQSGEKNTLSGIGEEDPAEEDPFQTGRFSALSERRWQANRF